MKGWMDVSLYVSVKRSWVLKQRATQVSVDLWAVLCFVFGSCPLQPRWRGCEALKIEISKVSISDSAPAVHPPPPAVSHIALQRTAVVISTDEVPLRKWDQAKERWKKTEQFEWKASQSVGLLTQKTSDRQAGSKQPEQTSSQAAAAESHAAVPLD